jgi:hypothetical protein
MVVEKITFIHFRVRTCSSIYYRVAKRACALATIPATKYGPANRRNKASTSACIRAWCIALSEHYYTTGIILSICLIRTRSGGDWRL